MRPIIQKSRQTGISCTDAYNSVGKAGERGTPLDVFIMAVRQDAVRILIEFGATIGLRVVPLISTYFHIFSRSFFLKHPYTNNTVKNILPKHHLPGSGSDFPRWLDRLGPALGSVTSSNGTPGCSCETSRSILASTQYQ
jgi:hypothetical protein